LKALALFLITPSIIEDRAVHDVSALGMFACRARFFVKFARWSRAKPDDGPTGEARVTAFWKPRFREASIYQSIAGRSRCAPCIGHDCSAYEADVRSRPSCPAVRSSAILAAMTRAADRPIKAFTIGHPGSRIDETAAAAEIARHLGASISSCRSTSKMQSIRFRRL